MIDPIAAGFRGVATRLAPGDLAAFAAGAAVALPAIEAVLDVEAGGAGFDSAGRPKILREPAVFWTQLGAGAKRGEAVQRGLAYPRWGMKPYPATSAANYADLAAMMAIDRSAALRSCSWGIGQVMGFNFAACGYGSVEAMVAAAMDSEAAQFRFLLDYCRANNLLGRLRTLDFLGFATGYNGTGQAAAYAAKLQAAFTHHGGAPATSRSPAAAALRQAPINTDSLNDSEWLRVRQGVA